jgi:hypothetical protein
VEDSDGGLSLWVRKTRDSWCTGVLVGFRCSGRSRRRLWCSSLVAYGGSHRTEVISSPCSRDDSSMCVRATTPVPNGAASSGRRHILDGTGQAVTQ